MHKKVKFSVIIPAHNEEDTIERAIQGVLSQTYKNFEIVISNDGSTDKTKKIVENLIKKENRIKLLNREKGHSAAFARNRGAETAKGEIFVFLDADCKIEKNFLEEISKNYKKADAFSFPCFPISTTYMSKILQGLFKPRHFEDGIYDKNSKNPPMFFCISKEAFKKIGGYDEEIFYFEDAAFAKRFYEKGFKSLSINTSAQYFELPLTFNEFLRQCKWIGKGINTIKDKKERKKVKIIWFLKTIIILLPFLFLSKIHIFINLFLFILLVTYLGVLWRNKRPILSIKVLPFFYIKNLVVTFNILKFWK